MNSIPLYLVVVPDHIKKYLGMLAISVIPILSEIFSSLRTSELSLHGNIKKMMEHFQTSYSQVIGLLLSFAFTTPEHI